MIRSFLAASVALLLVAPCALAQSAVGGDPDFELSAFVSSTTVAPGGQFGVNFTATNNTDNTVRGDLFFTASLGGVTVAQQNLFADQFLTANTGVSSAFFQQVPANAPLGTYGYTLHIGNFPNLIVASSETFMITVTAPSHPVVDAGTGWDVVDLVPWQHHEGEAASRATASVVAYPNPFVRATTLRFEADEAVPVRLAVYDVMGREVAVLVDRTVEAGTHEATFEASGLASGLYMWHLAAGDRVETGRITLVR